jgi:O-antigen/teichoic acid export membrane protein
MSGMEGPKNNSEANHGPAAGKKILHGVIGGTAQTLVTILVAFVQIRLILSFLPKDISGTWFLFLSIGAYMTYFDLGISPTLSREISFIMGKPGINASEKTQHIADLITTCQRFFQSIAVAVFLLGFGLGALFLLKIAPSADQRTIPLAWMIFSLGASLNLLGGAAFAALYGTGNVATERLIRATTQLIGLGFSALLLYGGFGIIGLSVAWVSQNLIARLWGWRALFRYHPDLKAKRGTATLTTAKKIAVPSLKWAAMGLGAILILQTDNPIIAATMGVVFIPSYEAAAKIVSALMTFSLLIVTSSTPFLSKAYAAGDLASFRSLLLRNVRLGMAAMLILAAFFTVFGDRVIDVWLGPGNFVGFPVLWTLLIMLTLEAHHVIHATATMAAGHLIFLWMAILSGIIKVGLSVLLASHLGLWGVALGTLIAQLLTNNWYAPYATLKIFNLAFAHYVKKIVFPLSVLALSMVTLNLGLRYTTNSMPALAALIVSFIVSSAAGLSIVSLFMMVPDERASYLKNLGFGKR